MRRILGFAMVLLLVSTVSLYGQESRVNLVGTSVMVSSDNSNWGLEVGGKRVLEMKYAAIKTSGGKFFVVEGKDGKEGICNDKGTFLFPCTNFKASVSGSGTISIIQTEGAKPKFYKISNPSVEVKAEQMDMATIREEQKKKYGLSGIANEAHGHLSRASKQAAEASAAAPVGAFSFKLGVNERLDLVVDGKVLFTADAFDLISDAPYHVRTGCWIFNVI